MDITDGNWTNELGGTTLAPSIDEVAPADDNDYIQSGDDPSSDLAEIALTNTTAEAMQRGGMSGKGIDITFK